MTDWTMCGAIRAMTATDYGHLIIRAIRLDATRSGGRYKKIRRYLYRRAARHGLVPTIPQTW